MNGMDMTGGQNWSTSVSYEQPDYKTVLTTDTKNKVSWKVPFVSALNQGYGPYDRDSHYFVYGNELFMESRMAAVNAEDNFLSHTEMPALVAFGFSPSVLAVVIADKTEELSTLTITFGRTTDNYKLSWANGGFWKGENIPGNKATASSSSTEYIMNWKTHSLLEKGSVSKSGWQETRRTYR